MAKAPIAVAPTAKAPRAIAPIEIRRHPYLESGSAWSAAHDLTPG
jgi:hypothetical protein